jgi:hypothetical protein
MTPTAAAVPTAIAEELSRCIQAFRDDPLGKSRRRRRKVARALGRALALGRERASDPALRPLAAALWAVSRAVEARAEEGLDEVATSTLWLVVGWGLARARAAFEATFPGVPLMQRQASGLPPATEQALRRTMPASLDARLRELAALHEHEQHLGAAEEQVSVLDKLNIFSESPEERSVADLQGRRHGVHRAVTSGLGQVRSDTWGALAGRAGAEAHYRLDTVLFTVGQLKAWAVADPRNSSVPFQSRLLQSAFYPGFFERSPEYSHQFPTGTVLGVEPLAVELAALGRALAELHGLHPITSPLDLARRCAALLTSGVQVEPFPADASSRRLHVDHVVASTAHGVAENVPPEQFLGALRLISGGGPELLQRAKEFGHAKAAISPLAKFLPFESESERRAHDVSQALNAQQLAVQDAEALVTGIVARAVSPYQPAVVHLRYLDVCRWAESVSSLPVRVASGSHLPKWRFELVGGAELYDATLALREAATCLYGAPLELLRGLVTGAV